MAAGRKSTGSEKINRKANRKIGVKGWYKAVKRRFAGQEIGFAEMDSVCPELIIRASKDPNVMRAVMIQEAIKQGVLAPLGRERWQVAEEERHGNVGVPFANNGGEAPKDPGKENQIPAEKVCEAIAELLLRVLVKKTDVFTIREIQAKSNFFLIYTWSAIGVFLSCLEKKHRYVDKVDVKWRISDAGLKKQRELRRVETARTMPRSKKAVVLPVALPSPKPPTSPKPQPPVQGKMSARTFSSTDLETKKKVLATLRSCGGITRQEFCVKIREEFALGPEVKGNAIGRVVFALINDKLIEVTWAKQPGKADVADKLRITSEGEKVLTDEVVADQPKKTRKSATTKSPKPKELTVQEQLAETQAENAVLKAKLRQMVDILVDMLDTDTRDYLRNKLMEKSK